MKKISSENLRRNFKQTDKYKPNFMGNEVRFFKNYVIDGSNQYVPVFDTIEEFYEFLKLDEKVQEILIKQAPEVKDCYFLGEKKGLNKTGGSFWMIEFATQNKDLITKDNRKELVNGFCDAFGVESRQTNIKRHNTATGKRHNYENENENYKASKKLNEKINKATPENLAAVKVKAGTTEEVKQENKQDSVSVEAKEETTQKPKTKESVATEESAM